MAAPSNQFFRDIIPEPHVILGLRMRPLSLGHLLLLHRIGSAFVTGGSPSYDDLAASVFLCSLTYEQGLEALDSPQLDRVMSLWQRKVCGQTGIRYWLGLKKATPIPLAEKCAAFRAYLEQGSSHPDYIYEEKDGKVIDLPLVQIVRIRLMERLHIPERDLMDRAWSLCLWDFLTLKSLDGEIEFVDHDDIEKALEQANEMAKRMGLALNGN